MIVAAAIAQPGVALAQGSGPAQPTVGDFRRCDGFGAPNQNGDGMTEQAAGFLGIFRPEPGRGDTTSQTPRFTAAGVAACDSALGQPRLAPNYHLRRASLLRARAIHRLSVGDYAAAIADLDRSDAEGAQAGTRLYDRSMGVGNRLLRAFALAKNGQGDGALALTRDVARTRPYSFGAARASALLSLIASGDWDQLRRDLGSMAGVHPQLRQLLFYILMQEGDFAAAVALRPQIVLLPPRQSVGGFSIAGIERIEAEIWFNEIELDTMTAFAVAATAGDEAARARIAAINARIEEAGRPLPPLPAGERHPRRVRDRHAAIAARISEATRSVGEIERLIGLLRTARGGNPDALMSEAGIRPLPGDAFGLHILRTLAAAAGDRPEIRQAVDAFATQVRNARTVPPLALEDLYEAMPGAELDGRIPRYGSARNFLGENTGNGFLVSRNGAVTTVNYGGRNATAAIVEEMALLRAADLAVAAGHSRIVVLARRTAQRTLHSYGMYGGGQSPEGFAGEISFISFTPGSMPEAYRSLEASSVEASAIIAELSPIYRPPESSETASR